MSGLRLLLITLLVLLGTIVIGVLESLRNGHEQQEQLSAKVTDLEQLFRQFAVLPLILANDPRLSAALTVRDASATEIANNALRRAVDRSDAAFAFLMDTSGLTIASSNFAHSVSFVGKNYGFRPYFTKAIAGESGTFFAVGATTGIPGYFVSEPVMQDDRVNGVVVVKLEPQTLPVSWGEGDSIALVTDELGVSILSTESRMLYNRTSDLDDSALRLIKEERRYDVSTSSYLDSSGPYTWQFNTIDGRSRFLVSSQPLQVEPWTLSLLTPLYLVNRRIAGYVLALLGACVIAGLMWNTYRQQARLSNERASLAKRLEQQIEERTLELKQAQDALIAQSNFAMLGKMSAAINHEINQPLASLRLNLATLRRLIQKDNGVHATGGDVGCNAGPDSIESTVVDLDRTAKRITRVIETLRAMPQQRKSEFVAVDVIPMLSEVTATVSQERSVLSRHLAVDLSAITHSRCVVLGERVLLQQALLNVLYNAFDAIATVQEPRVELRGCEQGDSIVLEVCDNGPGISAAVLPNVFEPFESDPQKTTGMGLGLTLARQILTDHGGTLSFRRGQCAGSPMDVTIFSITLPLLRPETQSAEMTNENGV